MGTRQRQRITQREKIIGPEGPAEAGRDGATFRHSGQARATDFAPRQVVTLDRPANPQAAGQG